MSYRLNALERAFELAKSGDVESVNAIRTRLKREGLDQNQVEGRNLERQLKALIRAARESAPQAQFASDAGEADFEKPPG